MKKTQFGKQIILEGESSGETVILNYRLLESPVGFGYSDLKTYGIEIEKTDRKPGMPDINECKQIEGIFFDMEEALSFIARVKNEHIMPLGLSKSLESYIRETVKQHREAALKNIG